MFFFSSADSGSASGSGSRAYSGSGGSAAGSGGSRRPSHLRSFQAPPSGLSQPKAVVDRFNLFVSTFEQKRKNTYLKSFPESYKKCLWLLGLAC